MMSLRRTGGAGLTLVVLAIGTACGADKPAAEAAPPAAAPAITTPPAAPTTRAPKDPTSAEVEKYNDIHCQNWPSQTPTRRAAAARAGIEWLRQHPDIRGPEVAAPALTDDQVAQVVEKITQECAGRQRGSYLIQLTAATAIIYEENPDLHP
jgi:hypothetical protein